MNKAELIEFFRDAAEDSTVKSVTYPDSNDVALYYDRELILENEPVAIALRTHPDQTRHIVYSFQGETDRATLTEQEYNELNALVKR